MQNYLAVIGDMIDSKKIKNREAVQLAMQEAFSTLNHTHSDWIASGFTMTIGDEFQALLKPAAQAWQILDTLMLACPVPFRLGLGMGAIRTKINPAQSLGADGEAFWNARDAIQTVHVQNWNGRSHVLFKGPDKERDAIINSLILSAEMIKSLWTESQKELFGKLLNHDIYQVHFNQKEIASELGFSESAFSKRLTASNIKVYFQLRETLGKLLEDYNDSAH